MAPCPAKTLNPVFFFFFSLLSSRSGLVTGSIVSVSGSEDVVRLGVGASSGLGSATLQDTQNNKKNLRLIVLICPTKITIQSQRLKQDPVGPPQGKEGQEIHFRLGFYIHEEGPLKVFQSLLQPCRGIGNTLWPLPQTSLIIWGNTPWPGRKKQLQPVRPVRSENQKFASLFFSFLLFYTLT
jgi:hypothetical protein